MSDMGYVLEQWDETAPDVQRQIVFALVERFANLETENERLRAALDTIVKLQERYPNHRQDPAWAVASAELLGEA